MVAYQSQPFRTACNANIVIICQQIIFKREVNNGKIEWTDEALMRVKKVPDFVRLGI
jgi:hypothetical protein